MYCLRPFTSCVSLLALLCCFPASLLLGQHSGSCSFSFDAEYLGAGNCFRVILRNADPQRSPDWVEFAAVDTLSFVVGEMDPARMMGDWDRGRWHFKENGPLLPNVPDTGYFCFISPLPTIRIALRWGSWSEGEFCRDTVQVAVSRRSEACVGIVAMEMNCDVPISQRKKEGEEGEILSSGPIGYSRPLSIQLDLQNRGERGIDSVVALGPGCSNGAIAYYSDVYMPPVKPGRSFQFWTNSFCLWIDETVEWKIDSIILVYFDSAGAPLCADTISLLLDQYSCAGGGSVSESSSGEESAANLRITDLESGEGMASFTLEHPAPVRLWLADLNGSEVRPLLEEKWVEAGKHGVPVKIEGLSSGTYLCILQIGEKREGRLVQVVQ